MLVKAGQTVEMRDGRRVLVTDASDPAPEVYSFENEGGRTIHTMPPENIFVGNLMYEGYATVQTVVSDMSEVVAVIE